MDLPSKSAGVSGFKIILSTFEDDLTFKVNMLLSQVDLSQAGEIWKLRVKCANVTRGTEVREDIIFLTTDLNNSIYILNCGGI